jgi:hypothetical protein
MHHLSVKDIAKYIGAPTPLIYAAAFLFKVLHPNVKNSQRK